MKLKPLQDWAVIKPAEAREETAGGIIIPDAAREKQAEGLVEAIGPGAVEEEGYGKKKKEKADRKFIPTTIKPGDYVVYEKYAGRSYRVGDEEIILVRERSILGMLPEGPVQAESPRRPLQIPAETSGPGTTALVAPVSKAQPAESREDARAEAAPEGIKAGPKAREKTSPKPKKAAEKKAVTRKKTVKKVVAKKAATKKAATKKATAKKAAVKKTAARKTPKKASAKTPQKSAKKPVKPIKTAKTGKKKK